MLRGFYTAASGMLVQQRNLNVIGENLTNSQTPGYRAQRVVTDTFDQELVTRLENGEYTSIGTGSQTSVIDTIETSFDESSLYESGNPYDMAVQGDGYFTVAGEDNTFLTRNGCFNIDSDGYLILEDVGRVQGENGDIYVGGSDFTVDSSGNVYNNEGNFSGRLQISTPSENATTIKYTNGLFLASSVDTVADPYVRQQVYERSNIDMNDEYTRLIEAQAAFKACSTALSTVDTLNQKAASSIASIT